MKINKLLYTIAFLGAFVFTSCEEETLTGAVDLGQVMYIADSVASASENGGTLTLVFFRTGTNFSSAVSADLAVSARFDETTTFHNAGDDAPGSFTLSKSSVDFASNVSSDTVVFNAVDDLEAGGAKSITITIGEASGYSAGTDDKSSFYGQIVITLSDDDCPFESTVVSDWVGTYTVFENFTGGVNAPSGLNNFFGETYQVEFALDPTSPTAPRVVITNSVGFNTYLTDGIVMTFLTCVPGEVEFSESPPNVALFTTFSFDKATYDEENFVIKAEGPLGTFGPYQFTFTKQ